MTIRPANNRLAIVDLPEEERGGLILPPGVAGRPDVGIVAGVSDGCPLDVQAGDKVFYLCKPVQVEDVKIIDAGCVVAIDAQERPF